MRDPHGVRPLCVGRLPTGWVIASETALGFIDGERGYCTLLATADGADALRVDEMSALLTGWPAAGRRSTRASSPSSCAGAGSATPSTS
mgnify:CR=1 FL=1